MKRSHQVILFSSAIAGWIDLLLALVFLGMVFFNLPGDSANRWFNILPCVIFSIFGYYSLSSSGYPPKLPLRQPILIVSSIFHLISAIATFGPIIPIFLNIILWIISFVNLLTAQLPTSVIGLTWRSTRGQPLPSAKLP